MRKKKEIRVFKEGVEAGVRPLKKKFDQISNSQDEVMHKLNRIRGAQRREQRRNDMIVNDVEANETKLNYVQNQAKDNARKAEWQQKQINDMKIHMPEVHSVCKECGKPLTNNQIVCSYCGRMVDKLPYDLKSFDTNYKETEELKELSRVIKSSKKNPTWIYPEMEDKFLQMQKIQDVAQEGKKQKENKGVACYNNILKKTRQFFRNYNDEKIEIALVGTVKAGKSSLINALIGAEVASVNATPETSILTKYRTTKNGNYLKIKYYKENEWGALWKTVEGAKHFINEYNETGADDVKYEYLGRSSETIECSREELSDTIMEWTSSDSPKHFFIKEIEVGYESDKFPNDVYLVDTPGLSDPVKYRSEITRRYISKSDWVIACFTLESSSGIEEFKTLTSIRSNKNNDADKIFIVATKKDQLSGDDAKAKKEEFLNRLKEEYEKCNVDKELAVSRFSLISANCHIYCKSLTENKPLDDTQKRAFKKILCEFDMDTNSLCDGDNVRKVLDYAGVDNLFEKMDKCVISRKREDILKEIERSYYRTMKEINKIASENIEKTEEKLNLYISDNEMSEREIDDLKEKRKELKKLKKQIEELKENLEVEAETDSIKMEV